MEEKKLESYGTEFRDSVLKECFETNNYGSVAKKHGIPATTVYSWIRRHKTRDKRKERKTLKKMEKQLSDLELENKILKELLKKSNQLWLKD